MKKVSKPIEVIATFDINGKPTPIKFRLKRDDRFVAAVKVDKICDTSLTQFEGKNIIVFKCRSLIGNQSVPFEINYELQTMKWMLSKI